MPDILKQNFVTILNKLIVLTVFITTVSQYNCFGQSEGKWNAGIFGGLGKDYLHRKYYVPLSQVAPGAIMKIGSKRSYAMGISIERFMNQKLTIETRITYLISQMPSGQTFNNYTLDYFYRNERHYRGLGSLGFKYYLDRNALIKYFGGAGMQGDYFLGHKRFIAASGPIKKHNAEGYNRFVPSIYLTLGAQIWRFQFSAEYQANVANTFAIDEGKKYNNPDFLKTSLKRQGVTLNIRFLIVSASGKPKTDFDE